MSDFSGKNVLVTGASSGIGHHFAKLMAGHGANVVAAARRVDALDQLARDTKGPGRIVPVAMDVTSNDSIHEALQAGEQAIGPIEILINNAGIAHSARATDITEGDYDRVFDTNVRGALFVAQAVGARMIELGIKGTVTNVASVAGMRVMPQLTVYGMSKAAIIFMTKCLAKEWARFDINVNALCPGYLATDLNAEYRASEAGQKMMASLPRKRPGEIRDLEAPLLLLIGGESSRLLNGTILTADDGFYVS
jgi:NAD(P)-dependent dehydrogenase (short-subunit alcohol dehydrogenase family)